MTGTADAARHLIAQRDRLRIYERLPEALRPADQAAGYAIQAEIGRLRAAEGRPLGGWKIGCTTKVMQEMMGLDSPAYGMVLADCIMESPATVARDLTVGPLAECEIAMRIGRDVPAREGGHDKESIADHVEACMAAIELAEMRYPDRKAMSASEFIADDFFQRAIVLGPAVTDWQAVDLGAAKGTTIIGGEDKGSGHGRDVMGHPLNALAWLADRLAAAGTPLKKGQVVLTGSIVLAAQVNPGQTAACAVEGLGEARLTVA